MANARSKNKLGQYWTPGHIAQLMVGMSSARHDDKVLEPSSGSGVFLDALAAAGFQNVEGVELDADLASHPIFNVTNCSFISWETDSQYDLVIGNPPYIRWKDLAAEQREEVLMHREFGTLFNSLSDYLTPFIALSVEKLRAGGELIFITPKFWMQTMHSNKLRQFLAQHGAVVEVVDFGEAMVFPGVSTSVVIFRFVKGARSVDTLIHRYIGDRRVPYEITSLSSDHFKSFHSGFFSSRDSWTLASEGEVLAPLALEKACTRDGSVTRLGQFVDIANGMVTGLDEAFRLSEDEEAAIPESERSGICRVVKARDLQPLYSQGFSKYIDLNFVDSEARLNREYASLKMHLERFRPALDKRYSTKGDLPFWRWSFLRSEGFHRNSEMLAFVPGKERLTNRACIRFSLARPGVLATQDVTAFAPKAGVRESVQYMVAFLAQARVLKWVEVFGLMKGGVAEFSEKPLSLIPLRSIDWKDEREIVLHDRITALVDARIQGAIDSTEAQGEIDLIFSDLLALPV